MANVRVVPDTNVYVSALLWTGSHIGCFVWLKLARSGW